MTTIDLTAADGHTLSAYVAEPATTPTAGIVVIQEIFGVNTHIREDADRFAAAGYLAVAPHMFDRVKRGVDIGYSPETIAEGREYAMALKPEGIAADVLAAIAELRARGVAKVGIVGYCFGGTVSAMAACNLDVDAAVSYYGGGIGDRQYLDHRLHRCRQDDAGDVFADAHAQVESGTPAGAVRSGSGLRDCHPGTRRALLHPRSGQADRLQPAAARSNAGTGAVLGAVDPHLHHDNRDAAAARR